MDHGREIPSYSRHGCGGYRDAGDQVVGQPGAVPALLAAGAGHEVGGGAAELQRGQVREPGVRVAQRHQARVGVHPAPALPCSNTQYQSCKRSIGFNNHGEGPY